jgi:hypothetical protein
MLTEQILRDAIAWGRAYGDAIPASQWDEMRDAKVKQLLAQGATFPVILSIRTVINVGTGYVLDGVGALSAFGVEREAGETDDSYRKRLLAKLDQLELPI